jgi:hypothetical protein
MKLIDCHDCGNPVSLSARWCPQCGSKDIAGPVRTGRRASGTIGTEAKNDRTLIMFMVALGAIGAFYGAKTGSSWVSKAAFTLLYGFVGVVSGVPIAFVVNVTRNWR